MDLIIPVASLVIAFGTLVFTTLMLRHQSRQMEHERNALAILEAVDRLTSSHVVAVFNQLRGIEQRYPTDDDIRAKFFGSEDERALQQVAQFVETIATMARREVLDASLLCDAVGWMIRQRWAIVEKFVARWRLYNNNDFLFENFEWLAKYSNWWKDLPRPNVPNYDANQFAAKQ